MSYNSVVNDASAIRSTTTVTIADGQTVSSAFTIPVGMLPVAVVFPSGWTTADLNFQASYDGTNYFAVNDSGDASTTSAAYLINDALASKAVPISREIYRGASKGKLVSGSAQAGGDDITVVFERFV